MFETFRHRLLFWFLIFISSSLIIISLSITYIHQREDIAEKTELVETAYIMLLQSVKAQQDFFSYETKNPTFFQTTKSQYLDVYNVALDSTYHLLSKVNFSGESESLSGSISMLQKEIRASDSLFHFLIGKVVERGFKNFNLIGKMRRDAHWLEEANELSKVQILSLRRHEKDYIIRNQWIYVDRLNRLAIEIEKTIRKSTLTNERQDSILYRLNGYTTKFSQLVSLDKLTGIKDNTGLKKRLDDSIVILEKGFSHTVVTAKSWMQQRFRRLTLAFGFTALGALIVSIILSYFIAKRITNPLTELTLHITKFVNSNFTLETDHPVIRSKDEIGKLTQNFSILKDEVISRLKFFKQKVDERTAELADANQQLQRVSEANSRFVPKEFLHFLGRKSIEYVQLGDQVEQEMTVVFTDIREFTKISETLSPQENFDFINSYLKGIVPIIQNHGGFIDKYIGDSVMALFPRCPENAIQAVFEFERFLTSFNESLIDMGRPAIEIGTGIHTGSLILGTIGHDDRLETTVISDVVNTASRVEGLTKHYHAKIIASQDTLHKLERPARLGYRFLDEVRVKGKSKSLAVYEFLQPDDPKLTYLKDYESGLLLMKQQKVKEAALLFEKLVDQNPKDGAIKVFLERCLRYLSDETSSWLGVEQMTSK